MVEYGTALCTETPRGEWERQGIRGERKAGGEPRASADQTRLDLVWRQARRRRYHGQFILFIDFVRPTLLAALLYTFTMYLHSQRYCQSRCHPSYSISVSSVIICHLTVSLCSDTMGWVRLGRGKISRVHDSVSIPRSFLYILVGERRSFLLN